MMIAQDSPNSSTDHSLDPRENALQLETPGEDTVAIHLTQDDPSKVVYMGSSLKTAFRDELIRLLTEYQDVFAWSHKDMPGIDPNIIAHRLNIDPKHKPVHQRRRAFTAERQMAIKAEVEKLLTVNFIKEVDYPEWVANIVLVRKANGKWRMCVDYSDLNKACPKDSFPTPRIDQLVDSTAGHALLSFMDAYSGYNQIMMHPLDSQHTAFIIDRGLYCYQVMPFGLKNAVATYQRLVNKIFTA